MSVSAKVANRVQRLKRGEPFAITGFYSLGNITAVQKALSRLVQSGELVRVSKGLYVRPKPLAAIPSVKITASATQVAQVWAKEHGYILVNQGEEAAYRLGLQTQAPMQRVFWSNGPSREFAVGNERVVVRHITKSKLHWASKPAGTLLRGLLVSKPEAISAQALARALGRLSMTRESQSQLIKQLEASPLLHAWRPKLRELERLVQ